MDGSWTLILSRDRQICHWLAVASENSLMSTGSRKELAKNATGNKRNQPEATTELTEGRALQNRKSGLDKKKKWEDLGEIGQAEQCLREQKGEEEG